MTAKKLFYSTSVLALALTALTSSPSLAMDDQDKSHLTVSSATSFASSPSLTSLDEQANSTTTTSLSATIITTTAASSFSSLASTSSTTTQEESQNTTTIMSRRARKRWVNHVGFQNLKETTPLLDELLFLTISYLQEPTADEYFNAESNPWFLPYPITINVEGGPLDIPTRCLILDLTFPKIEDSKVNLWGKPGKPFAINTGKTELDLSHPQGSYTFNVPEYAVQDIDGNPHLNRQLKVWLETEDFPVATIVEDQNDTNLSHTSTFEGTIHSFSDKNHLVNFWNTQAQPLTGGSLVVHSQACTFRLPTYEKADASSSSSSSSSSSLSSTSSAKSS